MSKKNFAKSSVSPTNLSRYVLIFIFKPSAALLKVPHASYILMLNSLLKRGAGVTHPSHHGGLDPSVGYYLTRHSGTT